jgi:hypothetical protein
MLTLSIVILSVITVTIVILSVIMLNVEFKSIMLSVNGKYPYDGCCTAQCRHAEYC